MGYLSLIIYLLCTLFLAGCGADRTQTPPPPAETTPAPAPAPGLPAVDLALVAEGLERPVGVRHAGDGSGRLFLLEQVGRVRVFTDKGLAATPLLDLTGLVTTRGNEQGLLDIAFDPRHSQNGLFYVHYSGAGGETVIARYRVMESDRNRADPASAEVILRVPQPYSNHNGGSILFGPDGFLYIALGDGGSAGDPQNNAQNLDSLLGKILRIDVSAGKGYAIPPGNPFAGRAGRDEIWAYGLRNPWQISFDRASGDLYIADVGQNRLEEINVQPAASKGGENYGWRVFEGTSQFTAGSLADAVAPVHEYGRDMGCSVTGGFVYRGQAIRSLTGTYVYGDYCSGRVWGLSRQGGAWVNRSLLETPHNISAFGQDEAGEIYLVHHRGAVYRLVAK